VIERSAVQLLVNQNPKRVGQFLPRRIRDDGDEHATSPESAVEPRAGRRRGGNTALAVSGAHASIDDACTRPAVLKERTRCGRPRHAAGGFADPSAPSRGLRAMRPPPVLPRTFPAGHVQESRTAGDSRDADARSRARVVRNACTRDHQGRGLPFARPFGRPLRPRRIMYPDSCLPWISSPLTWRVIRRITPPRKGQLRVSRARPSIERIYATYGVYPCGWKKSPPCNMEGQLRHGDEFSFRAANRATRDLGITRSRVRVKLARIITRRFTRSLSNLRSN